MRLEVKGLTKNFGPKEVLRGIDLCAESGKAVGILGRNGAGKTTAIRIIMQVFPPNSGEVLLDGKPMDMEKVRIGYLPEERGLYPKKPILEQLVYFGQLRGMTAAVAKKNAVTLMERLGMEEYLNKKRKLTSLSKGNQQKIQLAAALVSDPDIVILDEPFSGLDPVNAMLLEDVVRERIQKGNIVLFSSHQMNYIEEFCDDIAILNQGSIVLSGNIRDIKRSYDRSKLLVSGPKMQEIIAFAQAQPCVLQAEAEGGHACVQLTAQEEKQAFWNALAASGLEVDEFKVYEPSLNDIFVAYTEDAV